MEDKVRRNVVFKQLEAYRTLLTPSLEETYADFIDCVTHFVTRLRINQEVKHTDEAVVTLLKQHYDSVPLVNQWMKAKMNVVKQQYNTFFGIPIDKSPVTVLPEYGAKEGLDVGLLL